MNRRVNAILREKVGEWIVVGSAFIPGMIVAGFMPEANVLPLGSWFAIASFGGAIGGVVATPRTSRGALSGALAGFGMTLAILVYVQLRSRLTASSDFYLLEIVFVSLLGAIPGWLLYSNWARAMRRYQDRCSTALTSKSLKPNRKPDNESLDADESSS